MYSLCTAQWVKFFNASGIPSPAAASYAHIFVENRIQNDMLMDLNKEYLREMGITPMGDIIAILRHAKTVSDQTAREKVLTNSEMCVPIAAVPANPHLSQDHPTTTTKVRLKSVPVRSSTSGGSSSSSRVFMKPFDEKEGPLPKQARRVLPEHEGKYKIKLPSGNTKRSKEILAKKEKLYSQREGTQRSQVFERLAKNSASAIDLANEESDEGEISSDGNNSKNVKVTTIRNVQMRVTGIDGSSHKTLGGSSIFSRLGGKTLENADNDLIIAKQIKPILKNGPKTVNHSAIVKSRTIASSVTPVRIHPQKQKVILVKKVPLKTNDSDDDDDDSINSVNDMDMDDIVTSSNTVSSSEKIVKFASTAEVREIAPEPRFKQSPKERNYKSSGGGAYHGNSAGGVKSRLGLNNILHTTKKTYNLKAATNINSKSRISPVKVKSLRLKSDEIMMRQELPVHRRLGGGSNTSTSAKSMSALSKRVGKVNISKNSSTIQRMPKQKNSTSVFDRLGFSS
ncbi:uncharacterized protein LOC101457644 isoform X2 [Ceratitis capitata]|uniref:(Mediterranean fruit fly) hypothetical protein n=1 Tax=Ceratitis capitata TaxID=7213 RepID=A0A811UJL5_CERCA|nr:uncharacterized protein LOC101457644 isoform X2 [Ceratitis capitata]CAD6997895.1 unnamed protein product [Ceratitis capitata]